MSKQRNKVKFENRRPTVKLGDISSKYLYSSSSNDDKLQKKLETINKDQTLLVEEMKTMITMLQVDTRKNDQFIYEKVHQSLNKIINSFGLTNGNREKVKKCLIRNIKKYNIPSDLETKISDIIESEIDKFQIKTTEIETPLEKLADSTDLKLNKDTTEKIYNNLLSNTKFIEKLQSKLRGKLITSTIASDSNKFLNLINSFKRNNKQIFGKPGDGELSLSFSKLLSKTGKSSLFLLKYNNLIKRIFTHKVLQLKTSDWHTLKKNVAGSYVRMKIQSDVAKYFSSVKRIGLVLNPKFLLKKTKKILNKIGTTILNYFRYNSILTITKDIFLSPFKVIDFLGVGLIKLGFIGGKILLKGISNTLKFSVNVIKGIGDIAKNVLGGAITILKNTFGLLFKISKSLVVTGKQIFSNLKMFLMTPFGLYIIGYMVGFLKTKIKNWINKKFSNEKVTYYLNKYKTGKKNIKQLFLSETRLLIDKFILKIEDSKLEYEKDYFGVPKINKHNVKTFFKKKLLSILNCINDVISIFNDNDKNNSDQIKQYLERKTHYYEKLINTELRIGNWLTTYDLMSNNISIFTKLSYYLNCLSSNTFINELIKFSEDGVMSSGIMGSKIASGITEPIVKQSFITLGSVIGSIWGPLGSVAGGALGGGLGSLTQSILSHAFMANLTPSNVEGAKKLIKSIEGSYTSNTFDFIRNTAIGKDYKKIGKEIKDLERKIHRAKRNKNNEQVLALEKEKNNLVKKLRDIQFSFGIQDDDIYNQISSRIKELPADVLTYLFMDEKNRGVISQYLLNLNSEQRKELEEKIKNEILEKGIKIEKSKQWAEHIRFFVKQYAELYSSGGYGNLNLGQTDKKFVDQLYNTFKEMQALVQFHTDEEKTTGDKTDLHHKIKDFLLIDVEEAAKSKLEIYQQSQNGLSGEGHPKGLNAKIKAEIINKYRNQFLIIASHKDTHLNTIKNLNNLLYYIYNQEYINQEISQKQQKTNSSTFSIRTWFADTITSINKEVRPKFTKTKIQEDTLEMMLENSKMRDKIKNGIRNVEDIKSDVQQDIDRVYEIYESILLMLDNNETIDTTSDEYSLFKRITNTTQTKNS